MRFLKSFSALLVMTALVVIPLMAAADTVKQVNPKNICFMTEKRFNRTLPSVAVDGKKYYGCCNDCLSTLKDDPKSRIAVDPLTGKEVDKAAAIIGVDKDGKIYFFENLENLKKFRVPASAAPAGER